jgi:hypothetical protein
MSPFPLVTPSPLHHRLTAGINIFT